MKHSIVLKFIAVLLCAAALLGAVGSAAGILAMVELGLYQKSFDQVYGEYLADYAGILADELATRHAAMSLGGCNTQMADVLYGNLWSGSSFRFQHIGYELVNANGEVVQSAGLPESADVEFTGYFDITGRYAKVLRTMTEAEKNAQDMATMPLEEGTDIQVPVMPDADADIYSIVIGYTSGESETYGSGTTPLGRLTRQENGNFLLVCDENLGWMALHQGSPAEYIRLEDRNGETVYHAFSDRNAVPHYSYEGDTTWLILAGGMELPEEAPLLVDALPADGAEVATIVIGYADDSSESLGGVPGLGFLSYDDQGRVLFRAYDEGILDIPEIAVTHIAFLDENGAPLFEARDVEGVGEFYLDGESKICFRSGLLTSAREMPSQSLPDTEMAQETLEPENAGALGETTPTGALETVPEDTLEPTVPETAAVPPTTETVAPETLAPEATVPATTDVTQPLPTAAGEDVPETEYGITEPVAMAAEERGMPSAGTHLMTYYDYELGENMVMEYTYAKMPEYTVEIQFAPGALSDDYEWQLLRFVYQYQGDTLILLGVSLLVFALMAVYLCCAAGRKPGREEIKAGGLNALPLDLYLGLGFGAVAGLAVLGVEGSRYLMRSSMEIGSLFALLAAFGACLILVAFCFACAAQFKTPGGYWWRNSLCGRCLRLVGRGWNWMVNAGVWLGECYDSRLEPLMIRFFRALWKLIRFFWGLLVKGILMLVQLILGCCRWLRDRTVRFFSLLPLTWQWLLAGFVLILVLIISVDGFKDGNDVILPVGLLAAFGLILYGAHCFGVLLDSAKRMSKGDLDEKVDDQLLIGSFREFADELNGLADVAVVAAQKQLKSERMKTELITNVSHDIKTPLTSIINYVDLLQKPHTNEEQEVYLEVLDRQSQRLKKLVEDLMEMSKASTGNLAVDIQRVDAAEAVNQALGEFADKLEKAQLIPVFRQPEKPVSMMADGRLVWRVMSNLLGNAVKYALPGTRVYLDLVEVDGKVIISMKNISREELNVQADELLERFVRGDTSRNTEGSGLGLNIAKSLMELQKGQLQLLIDGDLFKVTLIFPGV